MQHGRFLHTAPATIAEPHVVVADFGVTVDYAVTVDHVPIAHHVAALPTTSVGHFRRAGPGHFRQASKPPFTRDAASQVVRGDHVVLLGALGLKLLGLGHELLLPLARTIVAGVENAPDRLTIGAPAINRHRYSLIVTDIH